MNMSKNRMAEWFGGERSLNFGAYADVAGTNQPAATTGNSFTDAISGLLTALTPAASTAVTNAIAGPQASSQQNLMTLYLQGKLPGYVINSAGQVVPKPSTSWVMPAILLAGGGLVLYLILRKKS